MTLRIATIGTSSITAHFADAVARVQGLEIGSVYSRDARRAAAFAAELGAGRPTDDLAQVHGPDNDAVYIASPNALHREQALAAVRAGKHVLVEKPAVLTVAEWDELVAAADAAGVVVLEAMRTPYDPGFAVLRDLLPRLGTIRRASLRYEKRSDRYDRVLAGERVNIFDPALGGGALNDLGVYVVHAAVSLFGAPDAVVARSVEIPVGDATVDGAGVILATYSGLVADLSYSKIATSDLPSEIAGEDGTLLIDEISSPRVLTLQRPNAADEVVRVEGEQHSLVGEVRRFVQAVASGSDVTSEQDRTLQTLRILEAVRASRPSGLDR